MLPPDQQNAAFSLLRYNALGTTTGHRFSPSPPPPPSAAAAVAVGMEECDAAPSPASRRRLLWTTVGKRTAPELSARALLMTPWRGGGAGAAPLGSKNKPKPPLVVNRESDAAMSSVLLELFSGCDVLACVSAFARQRSLGVSILGGYGAVSDVTLRYPGCSSPVTFRGIFDILSISGVFLPAIPRLYPSSSFPPLPAFGTHSAISLAGERGQVVGGVVEGPLKAAGVVRLMVATFASPEYQKVPPPRGGVEAGALVVMGEPADSSVTMERVCTAGQVGAVDREMLAEVPPWGSHAGRAAAARFAQPLSYRQQYY